MDRCSLPERVDADPMAVLHGLGEIVATFGGEAHGSGNRGYGIRRGTDQWFVKTAGRPEEVGALPFLDRVHLLRQAIRLARSCTHPTLPRLHRVVETRGGAMLTMAWCDGQLLRGDGIARVRALPPVVAERIIDPLLELHRDLERLGYVAEDLYDASLLYDFDRQALHVIDLDQYTIGPSRCGALRYGSSRFMAPEERQEGAWIDTRTTVFTLGRLIGFLLADGSGRPSSWRGTEAQRAVREQACQEDPARRFPRVEDLLIAWRTAGSSSP